MKLSGVVVGFVCASVARDGWAICREVGEPEQPPPLIEPDQSVLIVKRDDAVIGQDCRPAGADAGPTPDAGGGAADAGAAPPDAGATPTDAGAIADAGPTPDAGVVCEDILGPAIRMVVQPKFRTGPGGARFALLMVTPASPVIALEQQGLFEELAWRTERLVVVTDVCIETTALGYQCKDPQWPEVTGSCADGQPPRPPPSSSGGGGGGCGGGGGYYGDDDDDFIAPDAGSPGDAGPPSIQTIGAYEVVAVRPPSIAQLGAWLGQLGYAYEQADLDAIAPYSDAGWTVIAVRVAVDASFEGGLEPLSFSYPGSEVRLPLGISKQPPPAEARLAVYIAAEGRYDVPGATVTYANPTWLGGGAFLTRNDLWADLSRGAEDDPVAARVAGDPSYRETVSVEREIRIPSSECPYDDGDYDDGWGEGGVWGCGCRTHDLPSPGALLLFVICAAALRRRPRV